ncbi:glycosyltransferase family 9 protein [bacterium]|nr:glycosyltransferase family 9 protein [bacterium]
MDHLNPLYNLVDLSRFLLFHGMLDRISLKRVPAAIRENSVLIVRLDAIGDFILWLGAAKELRRLYPEGRHKITLLANTAWSSLAGGLPYWDEVWAFDRSKFLCNPVYRMRMLKRIQSAGFETVIHPAFSRDFFAADSAVHASSAREKIGFTGDISNIKPYQKRISDGWYTRLIHASPYPLMELRRNAEFVRGITSNGFRAGLPVIDIENSKPALDLSQEFYILFPGASWRKRMWRAENFAMLSERIYRKTGWTGVICGSTREADAGISIREMSHAPLIDLTGKTNLIDLACIIRKGRCLVGNETGAVHLAAALNTPSVCITGGGHFGRFIPYDLEIETDRALPRPVFKRMDCYGCNWICRYGSPKTGPFPCIDGISLDNVWDSVLEVLEK